MHIEDVRLLKLLSLSRHDSQVEVAAGFLPTLMIIQFDAV